MKKRLAFRQDGTFSIVQFTDVHWKNGDAADRRSKALMDLILEAEKPDFVVFTGDVIDSSHCSDPEDSYLQAVAAAEERQIPWAAVFGNHDAENGVTREQLMELQLRKCRYCLSEAGPPEVTGVGNFVHQVLDKEGIREAARLYFLDSGSYAQPPLDGYAWIGHDQTNWYLRESAGNRDNNPALAFFHIPLPEYDEVWRSQTCYGSKFEQVCCAKINTGFFSVLLLRGEIIATFAGHDHVNDYFGNLHGVRLFYGRATGFNTYGRDGFPRGARVIRLTDGQRSLESWIRLQDGTVVTEQPPHHPEG